MFPPVLKQFLLKLNEGHGYFCLGIDKNLSIVESHGNPESLGLFPPENGTLITDYLPILISENFTENFKIPFFNINENNVCDIHFIKCENLDYIMLVNKSEIFQVTQKYQQFAHDDNISKNKFKRLAEELNVAKQELKKSNQEKAALIAMLSHELGTPLTSIIGYSELMLNGELDKNSLKVIHRNAIHLKHTIENTLLFGRSQAKESDIHLEATRSSEFISELKDTLYHFAEDKGLALMTESLADEVIYIDIPKTRQILINLVNNAIKYTESGFVKIVFSVSNHSYIFTIIDSGIGIAEDKLDTVFSPWGRVGESREAGSGIGLYISQKLANSMSGKLYLKSSKKDIGSEFELIIPINKPDIKPLEENNIVTQQQSHLSVLIVDDDEDILDLLTFMLEPSGFVIHRTTTNEDIDDILKTQSIDVLLTDMNLGDVRADSFSKKIKHSYPKLPIILMSAMPSAKLKTNYKKLGFDAIIEKPLQRNKLISLLSKF